MSGGERLRDILFRAEILYVTGSGHVNVSLTAFRKYFINLAYVFLDERHPMRPLCRKPFCSCDIYGLAQQCMHTLYVQGLPVTDAAERRPFGAAPTRQPRGRTPGSSSRALCSGD